LFSGKPESINLVFADTHCHLDFDLFKNRLPEILSRMTERRLGLIVIPGVSRKNVGAVENLCRLDKRLKMGLGLHPFFIDEHKSSDLRELEADLERLHLQKDAGLVAIGEIGLDGTCPDMPKQLELFEAQLRLAEKFSLPVMIHSRKCTELMFDCLRRYKQVGGVIHAFSGSYELLMRFVKLGYYIGVGPVITWKGATKTLDAIARAPLGALVLETDAPGMRVAGREEREVSPFDVLAVFKVLSDIRAESVEELEQALWLTSQQLYRLPAAES
jgi:TatD DNase family protein